MTILLLVVMVVAAIVLLRGQQNQPDLRGMNDHDRAMAALHKLAEPGGPGGSAASVATSASHPRDWRSWRRPALALAVLVVVGTVVAARLLDTNGRAVVRTATRGTDQPAARVGVTPAANQPGASAPAAASPPTTTSPAPPATAIQPVAEQTTSLTPTAADGRSATYTAPASPFSLVVTAGGPCWAEVRDGNHQLLYEGTMAPGEVQTFNGTDLSLRLGAVSNVVVQVNGAQLVVPVKDPTPYNVRVTSAP